MSFAIVIKTKGLDDLPKKLERFRIGILARMDIMLRQIGQRVAQRSKDDYLSGPRPDKLGTVSGDLRRSVGYPPRGGIFRLSGNRVVVGSNLKYASIHERGFSGSQTVKQHTRIIKEAFGKSLSFNVAVSVGSFNRKMKIKARPYLSTALRDSKDDAKKIIKRIVGEVLKEVMV